MVHLLDHNGSPAGPAGQNNSIPAGKNNGSPAGPAGQNNSIPAGKNNGLPEPKLQLSEADIEKLVHNFSAKLRTTKQRGEKINKFASLLRNSTDWKTDPAVQKYLYDFNITLESVYDLFENAIVADHFMTFYAEACDDYDYSIDNIFDSI